MIFLQVNSSRSALFLAVLQKNGNWYYSIKLGEGRQLQNFSMQMLLEARSLYPRKESLLEVHET